MDRAGRNRIVFASFTAALIIVAAFFTRGFVVRQADPTTTAVSESHVAASSALPTEAPRTLTILMAGDVMLDRDVRRLGNMYGYDSLLADIAPLFKSADVTVANLEGPISSSPSKTLLPNGHIVTDDLSFTFATATALVLKKAGVSLVSLANNHSLNLGQSGLAETKSWLDAAGVGWFGDPLNASGNEAVFAKNGITVAFVGYHAFEPGFARVKKSVEDLSADGDFVIVMPHWGEEYQAHPSAMTEGEARELVAAGARAIVGSHPHIVMGHEWIGGVPVFFSLGNLLFDQYFSTSTMQGMIVKLELSRNDGLVSLDRVSVYETSLASRRGAELVGGPTVIAPSP
jgi:poly-gamma-glutamate synthesis protein (capsule biosynthesis protein)